MPSRIADQIDAGDVDAHAARRLDAAQHRPVACGAEDQLARARRPPRGSAARRRCRRGTCRARAARCCEAALELRPVGRRDQARQQAEREDLLGAARVARRPRTSRPGGAARARRAPARARARPATSSSSSCATRANGGRGARRRRTSRRRCRAAPDSRRTAPRAVPGAGTGSASCPPSYRTPRPRRAAGAVSRSLRQPVPLPHDEAPAAAARAGHGSRCGRGAARSRIMCSYTERRMQVEVTIVRSTSTCERPKDTRRFRRRACPDSSLAGRKRRVRQLCR